MPPRFARRLTSWVATLFAALAPGCAPTDTSHTLVLWHAWGGSELTALKAVIGAYETAHPGTEVLALQVPYDKLKDKYLRSSAANGGPDVLIGDADWSGKFAASQLALPTDELFTTDELARFYPSTLASLRLGQKLYALPESRETVALYYNKALVKTPPKSLGQLFTTAEGVTAAKGPDTYGLVLNATFYTLMGYFFGSGGKLFNPDGQPGVNSASGRQTYELLQRIQNAKGMLASAEYSKADSLYKEGHAAMIVNGPWALGDYRKALGKDLGLAPLPALDNGQPAASWVGVKCMMFNPNADAAHRAMAKDFALFVTSPESQKTLSEVAGHIPANRQVVLDPSSPLAVFQAQADQGTPVSIQPQVSLVWDPMDKAVKEVLQHEATPQEALVKADTAIRAKIAVVRSQAQ